MFFPRNSLFFPNYSFASQVYAIPMLFSAIRTVSSPKLRFSTPRLVYAVPLTIIAVLFPCFSPHYDSITAPRASLLCLHFSVRYSISRLFSADTLPRGPSHFLRLTTPSPRHSSHFFSNAPHFLSVARISRLSRSCCNQASDSLAVYSSHRYNLCSRY